MKRLKAKASYTYDGPDAIEVQIFSYLKWKTFDKFQTEQEAQTKAENIKGTWSGIRIVKSDGSIIKIK